MTLTEKKTPSFGVNDQVYILDKEIYDTPTWIQGVVEEVGDETILVKWDDLEDPTEYKICDLPDIRFKVPCKTPTQLLNESNEFTEILEFALSYREDKPEFEGYISTTDLAKMILAHKNRFVDKDWYSAGIMAQRIINTDEIESLKKKLLKEQQDHYYTRCAWEETTKDRDDLRIQVEALKDKIKIMNDQMNKRLS